MTEHNVSIPMKINISAERGLLRFDLDLRRSIEIQSDQELCDVCEQMIHAYCKSDGPRMDRLIIEMKEMLQDRRFPLM